MSSAEPSQFLEADVRCYLCGQLRGLLRQWASTPMRPPILQSDGEAPTLVRRLTHLRCLRCGGPVYADEFLTRYAYSPHRSRLDRPRGGRPPINRAPAECHAQSHSAEDRSAS